MYMVLFNFEICNLTLYFEHLSLFFNIYIYILIEAAFCYFQTLFPNVHSNISGATIRALFDGQVSLHDQWLPPRLHPKGPFDVDTF